MGKHDIIILLLDKNTPKTSKKLEKKVKGENKTRSKKNKPVPIPKREENKAKSFKNIAANAVVKNITKKDVKLLAVKKAAAEIAAEAAEAAEAAKKAESAKKTAAKKAEVAKKEFEKAAKQEAIAASKAAEAAEAATEKEIKLLSYNVLYKSFTDKTQNNNGEKIIKFINNKNPDIMVLVEASPLIPDKDIGDQIFYDKIKLKNYKYYGKKNTGGTIVYWSEKFSFEDSENNSHGLSICKDDINYNYDRPAIGVRLTHIESKKIYIIIGVHLGHYVSINDYKKGINMILDKMKYNENNEKIIIMGDHNELYENHKKKEIDLSPNTKLKLQSVDDKGEPYETCCGTDNDTEHKGKYNRPFDLLYSNVPNINMKVEKTQKNNKKGTSDLSDHYPLVGNFKISIIEVYREAAEEAAKLAAAEKAEAEAAKKAAKKAAEIAAEAAKKAAEKAAEEAAKLAAAKNAEVEKAEDKIIKQGIENHGNTCFINASLQAFIGLDKFIDNFVKLNSDNDNINIVRDIFKTILEGKGTDTNFELTLDKLLEIHESIYELIPTNNSRKIMNKKKNQSKKFNISSNSKLNKNRYLTKKNNNNNKLTFNNLKNFKNNDIIYYHIKKKYENGLKTQLKKKIKYKISFNNGTKFKIGSQQDAAEFIEYLFGIFESVKDSHSESFIYNDFNIGTQTIKSIELKDKTKYDPSDSYEHSTILQVEINGKSIKECIDSYLKEEVMKGEYAISDIHNIYCKNMKQCYCDQDKVKKKINIIKCPKYLIIHLKRFDNAGTKINQIINFEEKLVLNQIKDNSTVKHNYDLVSIIVHIGQNPKSGHYICYSKRNNNWYEFNDSKVTIKNFNDLKKELVENGYMFFYQKSSTN
tara:strand:- start:5501 stop:8101 length:2601 start_codon:yes stop_codon:yes gene_type:complete